MSGRHPRLRGSAEAVEENAFAVEEQCALLRFGEAARLRCTPHLVSRVAANNANVIVPVLTDLVSALKCCSQFSRERAVGVC